jgi:hypothetical protein
VRLFGPSALRGIHEAPGLPDTGVYRGREGHLGQIEKLREAFRDIKWELRKSVDYGDRVLSVVRATGFGSAWDKWGR